MANLEDLTPEMRDELAKLALQVSENKETRAEFLRMTAKVTGNHIPEIAIEDKIQQAREKDAERIKALEDKLAEKEIRDEVESKRRSLIAKGKVKDETELAEVEKLMLEKKIVDHETAADYWSMSRESAKPTPATAFSMNVMDKTAREELSKFWKNPQGAARDMATQALLELRKNPKPIGL